MRQKSGWKEYQCKQFKSRKGRCQWGMQLGRQHAHEHSLTCISDARFQIWHHWTSSKGITQQMHGRSIKSTPHNAIQYKMPHNARHWVMQFESNMTKGINYFRCIWAAKEAGTGPGVAVFHSQNWCRAAQSCYAAKSQTQICQEPATLFQLQLCVSCHASRSDWRHCPYCIHVTTFLSINV